MELPFEKTVCRCWSQKICGFYQSENTQELRIPDGMPDAGRIIGAWGQEILRGKDWNEREICVSGGMMIWVLYAPEDGSDPQRLETWIPFQIRVDMPHTQRDGVVRAQCVVRSVDARITSSRKLIIRSLVGMMIQTMEPMEVSISLPGDLPEDVEVLRNRYPMNLTVEAGEKTFMMEEDPELPQGMSPVERIVYFQIDPEIQEQRIFGNRGVFRGIGNLHVLYWSREGRLCCCDIPVPFSQYMDLESEYSEGASVSNLICITSAELDVTEGGRFHLRCGGVNQYTVQDLSVLDLVEDAYSLCRDVELQYDSIMIPAILDSRQQTLDLNTRFSGENVSDAVFMSEPWVLTRTGDDISVSAGGEFGFLTEGNEGLETVVNHASESVVIRTDPNADTCCLGWQKTPVRCRREGGDWRVDTRVVLDLSSVSKKPVNIVSGMTLGDLKNTCQDRPSVIIRRKVEQERLWDLAKNCGSTVEAIRRINRLDIEPEEDRLLLIPVL